MSLSFADKFRSDFSPNSAQKRLISKRETDFATVSVQGFHPTAVFQPDLQLLTNPASTGVQCWSCMCISVHKDLLNLLDM